MGKTQDYDDEVFRLIEKEEKRQRENIELIASENVVSHAVMAAQGSILTNKYAEGYPHRRYYGGCNVIDEIETLAIERLKKLFNVNFANVQPHSGSQANFAVYLAELNPGDKFMGMNLSEGGHLTHGSPVNFSGKLFSFIPYGVDAETGYINYERVYEIAMREKPKMIIAGASVYSRIIDFGKFRKIADDCGAVLMVDMAHIAGLVAAGIHPSPIPYADYVTSTTHKTLRGPRGGIILSNSEEKIKKANSAVFPGSQGGPLEQVIAAKAVAFKEALSEDFKIYQKQIVKNAQRLAQKFSELGFDIVSGGTDNHLLLMDLTKKNITGKKLETALDEVHITLNKNSIPQDPLPHAVTSGVRIGTPAVTSRGMTETHMDKIALWISHVCDHLENPSAYHPIAQEVLEFTAQFPLRA